MMSDSYEIIIPPNAGLGELRQLLAQTENVITKLTPLIAQYKINRGNARAVYDDALSTAKINAIAEHDLKMNHQTMINAYANTAPGVKELKQAWLECKAIEIKAVDRLGQIQGQRDTLKAMVKSEQFSY
jgi:hypothetical protein